jgi:hypothetical protein
MVNNSTNTYNKTTKGTTTYDIKPLTAEDTLLSFWGKVNIFVLFTMLLKCRLMIEAEQS